MRATQQFGLPCGCDGRNAASAASSSPTVSIAAERFEQVRNVLQELEDEDDFAVGSSERVVRRAPPRVDEAGVAVRRGEGSRSGAEPSESGRPVAQHAVERRLEFAGRARVRRVGRVGKRVEERDAEELRPAAAHQAEIRRRSRRRSRSRATATMYAFGESWKTAAWSTEPWLGGSSGMATRDIARSDGAARARRARIVASRRPMAVSVRPMPRERRARPGRVSRGFRRGRTRRISGSSVLPARPARARAACRSRCRSRRRGRTRSRRRSASTR